VSEQHAEQTSGGSVGAESVVTSQASAGSVPAKPEVTDAAVPTIQQLDSPMISPDHEAPKADTPKIEPVKLEQAKTESAKSEPAKSEPAKAEPIGLDQIKPDPITIEPTKVEPIKAESMDVAPAKVEPAEAPKLELASLAAAAPTLGTNDGAKAEPIGSPATKPDMPRAGRLVMAPAANDSLRAEAIFAQAAAAARGSAKPETSAAPAVGLGAADRAKAEQRDPPRASAAQPVVRRTLPIAAMLAIAVLAGAAGGALATIALVHGSGGRATAAAADGNADLSESVGKMENDIATLKASLEQINQSSLVELNKTSERLDKVEKAQGELAKAVKPSELQKLSEAVERLRTAQASATPAAARERETTAARETAARERETTASIAPATSQPAAMTAAGVPAQSAAAGPAVGRLPVVEGWVLRDVGRGGALIEGRQGLYEVYAGDPVPGLGKVDAIRKQDGRWVVVTTKGLVVAR
jgi:hypothetical protein